MSFWVWEILFTGVVYAQANPQKTVSVERGIVKFYLDLDHKPLNQNLVQLNVATNSLFQVAIYAENLPPIFGQSFEARFDPTRMKIQGFELYPVDEKNIMVANFRELTNVSKSIDQIEGFIQVPLIETLTDGLARISTKVSRGESSRIFSYEGSGLVGSILFQVSGDIGEVVDTEFQIRNHKIAYAIEALVETLLDAQEAQIKIIPEYIQIAGDFDDSGHIDFTDFLLFAREFGKNAQSSNWQPVFDLNQDLTIDSADFSIFVRNFRKRTK